MIPGFMNGVKWNEIHQPAVSDAMPYATHSGEMEIMGVKMRCYRLSDGCAVFHEEDFEKLMAWMAQS